ncbi:MAG TPA: hypothetical protein VNU70_03155 [Puia sp.]|jgi:hypothetical protein|nr:hypothetical protein [Puia sp.]
MDKQRLSDYLKDIPKPAPPPAQGQEMLKLTLMNARRSSVVGTILIILPGGLILLFLLQNNFHLFPGLTRWLAGEGTFLPLPLRAIVAFLFLVGFPLLAVVFNLLAITWFRYDPIRKEWTITIRMRWRNVLVAGVSSALASFYVLHLLADTILGKK